MKITIIGHASLLIETKDLCLVTDPVFSDPFADEVRETCPKRVVDFDKLPPIDVLFLSHNHNDHFDIPTLAMLPNVVDTVLTADHPHILRALDVLGFERVQPIRDYERVEIGQTSLTFTPSAIAVPEHGLLARDPTGCIWNQVDTIFDTAHLKLLRKHSPIDVHFANFNPLLPTECQSNGRTSFPYDTYEELFEVIRLAEARTIVPWASGQIFTGSSRWLNPYFFPVSAARFIQDIQRFGMKSVGRNVFPGDVMIIEDGKVEVREQASDFVRCVDKDLSPCDFEPGKQIPLLTDDNVFGVSEAELDKGVQEVLEKIRGNLVPGSFVVDTLRNWGAVMRISVHYPSRTRHWNIDFEADRLSLHEGKHDLANFVVEVTASGVYGVHRGLMWDRFVRGGFRSYDTLYRAYEHGLARPRQDTQGRMRTFQVPSPFDALCTLWGFDGDLWVENQLKKVLKNRRVLLPRGE